MKYTKKYEANDKTTNRKATNPKKFYPRDEYQENTKERAAYRARDQQMGFTDTLRDLVVDATDVSPRLLLRNARAQDARVVCYGVHIVHIDVRQGAQRRPVV